MKDWRGVEIQIGDTVVYPTTQSSSLTMNEAIVDEVTEGPDKDWKGRLLPVVWVIRQHEHYWNPNNTKVKPKRVKLTRPDRITVVAPREEANV